MKAYVFPGQGAQYPGMGKDLYEASSEAKALFNQANAILGFSITDVMFEGSDDDLKQTRVTQPAIFLHSVLLGRTLKDFSPDMVAGHSLGEFSALVAAGALTFGNGLSWFQSVHWPCRKPVRQNPQPWLPSWDLMMKWWKRCAALLKTLWLQRIIIVRASWLFPDLFREWIKPVSCSPKEEPGVH